jgi:HlyD family secretion protein
MKVRNIVLIVIGLVGVATVIGYFVVAPNSGTSASSGGATQTGNTTAQVTAINWVTSVESSGSVEAIQSESLSWETTGTVVTVNVAVGDTVKKGDVLMAIDPATAPQSVIQAYVDLDTAQDALEALLNPSALDIANAKKAVADAEQTLTDAKLDLKYAQNPVGQSLYDTVSDAKLALDTALANQQLEHVSTDASAIKTTEDDMNLAYSRLQRAQTAMDDCLKISCGERTQRENELNNAQKAYQTAWDAYQTAKLKYDTNVANQADDVRNAQQDYDQAVANLNAALAGPDALKVQTAQAAVEVAEADLVDKQETLNKLLNGADPKDIAAAQANVLSAQTTIDSLTLKAPFDGEVLQVNFRPGDTANQSDVAVMLANRAHLHVDVAVDESDISQVNVGDPATLSFDFLPDLSLTGKVSQVVPIGEEVQGLVKYTVRVDFDQADSRVLLGMTTNASIVTDTVEGALAVPVDAVQQDDSGEYVNRVGAGGALEKVTVVSGEIQEDGSVVVVSADLQVGDTVQVVAAQSSASSGNTGGPGGGPFGGP